MKTNYTQLQTIGTMSLVEATEYVLSVEEIRKETNSKNQEIELNVQVVVTSEEGLLLKESATKYHFVYLKEKPW